MNTKTADSQGVPKNLVITISSITRSGSTATIITANPHYLVDNDLVYIRGADQSDYNVDRSLVSKVDEHTFTVSVVNSPTTPATGDMWVERANPSTGFQEAVLISERGEQLVVASGHTARVSDEMARPANTTPYSVGDVVGMNLAVTGATNATPIVITTAAHGMETGDKVTIAGVGGNTAANGDWEVTVLTSTTFSLKTSVGNGAYTSGGTVARAFRMPLASRNAGDQGYVLNVKFLTDSIVTTNGSFRAYLFKEQPAALPVDNSPFLLLYADRAKIMAKVDFILHTEGSGSDSAMAFNDAVRMAYVTNASFRDVFVVLTAQAAYVPTSGQNFHVELALEQN